MNSKLTARQVAMWLNKIEPGQTIDVLWEELDGMEMPAQLIPTIPLTRTDKILWLQQQVSFPVEFVIRIYGRKVVFRRLLEPVPPNTKT